MNTISSASNFFRKRRKGFTMPEIILYIGLTSVLMVTLMRAMLVVLEHDSVTQNRETVQQEVRRSMDQILYEIREAESVVAGPTVFNSDNGVLVLSFTEPSRNPTEIKISANAIVRRRAGGSWVALTGENLSVSALRFEKRANTSSPAAVSVSINASEIYSTSGVLETEPVTVKDEAIIRKRFGVVDPRDIFENYYSSSPIIETDMCGNGILDLGEVCDDGNTLDGDTCSADCLKETVTVDLDFCPVVASCENHPGPINTNPSASCTSPANCGDWDCNWTCPDDPLGEGTYDRCIFAYQCACDKGGGADTDVTDYVACYDYRRENYPSEAPSESYEACNVFCGPMCPDGNLDDGEACDEGGDTQACDGDCTFVLCGDGYVNEAAGEECDGGSNCSVDCKLLGSCCTYGTYTCEQTVSTDCMGVNQEFTQGGVYSSSSSGYCYECYAYCGNGFVDAGEECDDGNWDDGDGCSYECTIEYCCDGASHTCLTDLGACTPASSSYGYSNVYSNFSQCDIACAVCGDGVISGLEECDDGASNSNTIPNACRTNCKNAYCGDAVVDSGEICDDGGNTATCDNDCTVPECGDGVRNTAFGEECDDGNQISGDGCYLCQYEGSCCTYGSYTCAETISGDCVAENETFFAGDSEYCEWSCYAYCGNGYLDPGEDCDDGNWEDWDDCASNCQSNVYCCEGGDYGCYGPMSSDYCADSYATYEDCEANCSVCGNGILESGEDCDDGNWDDGDGCYYCQQEYCCDTDTHTCSLWSLGCYNTYSTATQCDIGCAYCGDGVIAGLEECDDGASNSNTIPNACRTNCKNSYCGDGVQDTGEICDTGGNSLTCDSDCTAPLCGDGIRNVAFGEDCDDGNTVNGDGCSSACDYEGGCCTFGTYTCTTTVSSNCIGANQEFYEDEEEGSCDWSCYAYCGNGFLDTGEECDDGNWYNGDGCASGCKLEYCCRNDGACYVATPSTCNSPGEIYYSGYYAESNCAGACDTCGDTTLDPGEDCDDGNTSNTDACLNTCIAADCGDGYVWSGHEQCDDGNTSNTDVCLNTCVAASCGDGYVRSGYEQCDDGNLIDGDGCSNCKTDVYCCDLDTADCSESKIALASCTSGIYSTNKLTCEANCGVVVSADFCPVKSCFGYPGNSTYCSNPVQCGIIGQSGWDCNWDCNGDGALGDGNYSRCIGAYKCACMMGGGDKNVADFLDCYTTESNDVVLLEACLSTYCNP